MWTVLFHFGDDPLLVAHALGAPTPCWGFIGRFAPSFTVSYRW